MNFNFLYNKSLPDSPCASPEIDPKNKLSAYHSVIPRQPLERHHVFVNQVHVWLELLDLGATLPQPCLSRFHHRCVAILGCSVKMWKRNQACFCVLNPCSCSVCDLRVTRGSRTIVGQICVIVVGPRCKCDWFRYLLFRGEIDQANDEKSFDDVSAQGERWRKDGGTRSSFLPC